MSFTTQSRDYPFDKVFFFYRDRDGKAPEVLKIYGQVSLLFVIQSQINQNRNARTLDAGLLNQTSRSLGH